MLIIPAIVLLLLLPSPWNVVVFLVLLGLWVVELAGWNRTVKKRRKVVGVQTMVDRDAVVVEACLPRGQVRLDGETWGALCEAGARAGETVHVTRVDGLTLVVEPAPSA